MTTYKKLTTKVTALALALGAVTFAGTAAQADQVINDDLIVTKDPPEAAVGLCVGLECAAGESFGYDSLRFKEDNLRIHFDDTSDDGVFAENDWRIIINDATNSGTSHFSIEDATAESTPLRIEAGAPSNALVVENDGDVGMGTLNPVVKLHVVDGDTPTLRLQQDGSSGFVQQTWDIAGNEASFFLRDVSNASNLVFRIRPRAPHNALLLDGNGNLGIGLGRNANGSTVQAADAPLHVRASGTHKILFENSESGPVQVRLLTDSTNRRIVARNEDDTVTMSQIVLGDGEIKLAGARDTGDTLYATINASGIVTLGPTCNTPCDAVFDPDVFKVESIDEHAEYMWKNKHLLGVGPTSPELPFNVTEKTAGILNELEKAHIYIEQLHQRLEKTESQQVAKTERAEKLELAIADLRKEIAELRATSQ